MNVDFLTRDATAAWTAADLSMAEPYLHLRWHRSGWQQAGLRTAYLGQRAADGSPERWREVFAEWSWDSERLTVRIDRYGFFPLYYFVRTGEFGISPSITRLLELGAPLELDDAGLALFLRMGNFVGEDTAFRGIRALPPGATLVWGREGVEMMKPPLAWSVAATLTRDDAMDGFIALFRQSIERRLHTVGDVVLPLSGGRDSRHILHERVRAGCPPRMCVTMRWFPPRPDTDGPIAAELARRLRLRHTIIDPPRSRLHAELRKNRLTGFSSLEGAEFLALADFVARRAGTLFDGLAGDILTQPKFLDEDVLRLFAGGRFRDLAERYLSPPLDRIADRMLPRSLARRFSRTAAGERLVLELRRYADLANPHAAFRFYNRARRNVALNPLRLFGAERVVLPYLDDELFDFLSSLPGSMLLGRSFHTDALRRAFPEHADLPFARYGDIPVNDVEHFRGYARELGQLLWRRRHPPLIRSSFAIPRVLGALANPRWSQDVSWLGAPIVYLMQLGEVLESKP